MSSLTSKDRVSLCLFSFTDGRRCRTPRIGTHPHFCYYHAQKEAQAQAAEKLAKDLAAFFSGDYLSACDLSTALARLIPAVVRGDIKPRLARTVAYMFQSLIQSINLSQREYITAFGTETWRKAVRSSVNTNYDYRFPSTPEAKTCEPTPEPEQPAPPAPPSPTTPVGAGLARPGRTTRSDRATRPKTQPVAREDAPAPRPNSPATPPQPEASASHAKTHPALPPNATATGAPHLQHQPNTPNRDPYAVHYDHNYRLVIDGKPF